MPHQIPAPRGKESSMRHASIIAVVLGFGLTAAANAQKRPDASPPAAAKIASARSAAPAAISANATIAEMTPDGKMTTLVKGTNGWLCMPEDRKSTRLNSSHLVISY